MRKWLHILTLLLLSGIFLLACRKEEVFNEDQGFRLGFSNDTITFDTVFTSVGSATQWLVVRNPSDQPIRIASISLEQGQSSRFRINVDGEAVTIAREVEIAARDSIFIFIRVTIDPNQADIPLVVEDAIQFEINGSLQQVHLVAWGQDAHFYRRAILQGDHVWMADKPHVIYDWIIVDSSFSLTILEGTQVHLHAYSVLAVNTHASLKVQGSAEHPVRFSGDRLEEAYQDVPGQWGRIWLSPGSINNVIDYALIENGQVGVHVDTLGPSTEPTLVITNSIIRNMSSMGMLLQGSDVEARNCIIAGCGEFAVLLNLGGRYDFRHCTIGNYYNFGIRQTPSVVLNNYYLYENDTIARDLESVYFGNCILWGRNAEELLFDRTPRADFNFVFDHCIIRTEMIMDDPLAYLSCLRNADPRFMEPYAADLSLLPSSPAIDAGDPSVAGDIPLDITGFGRLPLPDLGAIEYQPE